MAKEEASEFEGTIRELLPNAMFKVRLDNGHEVVAYASGKIKKNKIKILVNDKIIVAMSRYDVSKARIILRLK